MNTIIILLTILEVLVCLLLIGVILLQRSKGSGAGVSFGGGAAEAVFGAQMGNVLTKSTVILAIVFLVNTLMLSLLVARRGGVGEGSLMGNETPRPAAAAPAAAPTAPLDLPDTPSAGDAASVLDDVPVAADSAAPAESAAPAAPAESAAPAAPAASAESAPAAPAAPAE
jgi:preprotein translocase subunit SecG